MAEGDAQTFGVEVRKVTSTTFETGTEDTTADTYQLGAVIEGKFVPFVTKAAGYIEHLRDGAQADEQPATDSTPANDGA